MNRTSRISRARTTMTVLAGAGVAAGLLATTIAPASADKDTTDRGPKPTVVLVHGAFADSTSWNGVIDKLRHDGYPVAGRLRHRRAPVRRPARHGRAPGTAGPATTPGAAGRRWRW
ncbi:hypothetical protein [Streptomyces tendae]